MVVAQICIQVSRGFRLTALQAHTWQTIMCAQAVCGYMHLYIYIYASHLVFNMCNSAFLHACCQKFMSAFGGACVPARASFGCLLGTDSAECHWNENKCGFAMATEECQRRRERQSQSPTLTTAGEEERRTWLNTTISPPGASSLRPFYLPFLSAVRRYKVNAAQPPGDLRRHKPHYKQKRSLCRFLYIYIYMYERTLASSMTQSRRNSMPKIQFCTVNSWSIKVDVVSLMGDSQFKLACWLHQGNLWLIHSVRSVNAKCCTYMQHATLIKWREW